MAATNRDVQRLVADGALRQDLYYRLAGLEIVLPPLRERREDVADLVARFVEEYCFENNRRIPAITPAALAELARWPFPGNIRELRNVVDRTLLLADGDTIGRFLVSASTQPPSRAAEVVGPLAAVKKELMRRHLSARLAAHGGDRRRLAAELEIHANNVARLLREYGVEPDAG